MGLGLNQSHYRGSIIIYTASFRSIKGIYLSKALTCMNFFLYIFIKETDTFGHIVV